MGANTSIEWCHRSFSPWWGCQRVSPGCERCFAEAFAKRVGQKVWGPQAPRRFFGDKHWDEPRRWNKLAARLGERRRVFCSSMADVFEDRDDLDEPRARLWKLIEETPALDWLLLTKRPQNHEMVPLAWQTGTRRPANVWFGCTAEDQRRADDRIPHLLAATWPAVRFVSYEPALERVNFSPWLPEVGRAVECVTCGRTKNPRGRSAALESANGYCSRDACSGYDAEPRAGELWPGESRRDFGFPRELAERPVIDWVICGGESGPGARPFHLAWARSTIAACRRAGTAVFVKQLGADPVASEPTPGVFVDLKLRDRKGGDPSEWPAGEWPREFPGGAR